MLIELVDESHSKTWAARLAHCCDLSLQCRQDASEMNASEAGLRALILTFSGEIGVGKTTFIRAMLRALGIKTAIKSPTFSLVESYHCQHLQIHHLDLYRIQDESELEYIGFRDYFLANAICCIEWPERANQSLQKVDLHFSFAMKGSGRLLAIKALSPAGQTILSCLIR